MQSFNEELVRKWQPILEHADLPEIQDPHKRQVTACVLENTETALKLPPIAPRILRPSVVSSLLSVCPVHLWFLSSDVIGPEAPVLRDVAF